MNTPRVKLLTITLFISVLSFSKKNKNVFFGNKKTGGVPTFLAQCGGVGMMCTGAFYIIFKNNI